MLKAVERPSVIKVDALSVGRTHSPPLSSRFENHSSPEDKKETSPRKRVTTKKSKLDSSGNLPPTETIQEI